MPVSINGSSLVLTGVVGAALSEDFNVFTHHDVVAALSRMGSDTNITVRLNSGGGIATEGAAIHAALAAHKGAVDVIVEGVAASAASLIAVAGQSCTMSAGAIMMVHEPWAITLGDAAAHAKTIEALDVLAQSYAGIYAQRTRKTAAAMRALMRAETWMTADQAVTAGFADRVAAPVDARNVAPAAFAYGTYARAPLHLLAKASGRQSAVPEPAAPPFAASLRTAAEVPAWASRLAQMCSDANCGLSATDLISEGVSIEEAAARLNARVGGPRVRLVVK